MRSIYFDYNATTPLDAGVRDIMLPLLDPIFGNPSSIHHLGRKARTILDESRELVASIFQCKPSEITFTSGGTESNNLAILGSARARKSHGKHLITSAIEHHAVLQPCAYIEENESFQITRVPVDSHGLVDPEDVKAAIRPDTSLVSIMAANNETGVLQPVQEIGDICRSAGVLFHTDAVQWFGKGPFQCIEQFHADLVSLCSHKFHGPKGAGVLYIRSPLQPHAILMGGGHENERRAGTENLAAIVGLAAAVQRFVPDPVFPTGVMTAWTGRIDQALSAMKDVSLQGRNTPRLSNTLSFTVEGCDSISLLAALDLEGICASSGSACSSGALQPSHVLQAMGVPDVLANSFVRFSLGRESTSEEVDFLIRVFPVILQRIRSLNNSG